MDDICPFYVYESTGYFSSRETCNVTQAAISSDTYKRYCKGNYSKCPNYTAAEKSQSSGSGCYLTTACVEAMGLPDDCRELTVLRNFRDHWLREKVTGPAEIAEYYEIAPQIVERIQRSEERMELLKGIYDEMITPCVDDIQAGNYETAHERYRRETMKLKERYLNQ